MCLPLDLIHKVDKILAEDPDVHIVGRSEKSLEMLYSGLLVEDDNDVEKLPELCRKRIGEIKNILSRYEKPSMLVFFVPEKTLNHESIQWN